MTRFNRYVIIAIVLIALLILLLRSCETEVSSSVTRSADTSLTESYEIVPAGAAFIFSVNTSEVLNEIDFEQLRTSESYQQKLESTYYANPPLTLVFADPIAAGIDISKKSIFYVDVGSDNNEVYNAFVFPLKDKRRLALTFSNNLTTPSVDYGTWDYMDVSPQLGIGWNDHFAVFVTTNEPVDQQPLISSILNPKERKYIDDHPDYLKWIRDSASDISYWIDMTNYALNQVFPKAQGKEEEALEVLQGNVFYGNVEFSDGKISIDNHLKLNEVLKGRLFEIFDTEPDQEILDNIPKKNFTFLAKATINIDQLFQLALRDVKSKLAARKSLIQYGLVLDDFREVFTGDLIISAYPASNSNRRSFLFALKIKDNEKFNNLLKVANDLKYIVPESDNVYRMPAEIVKAVPVNVTYADRHPRMLIQGDYIYVSGVAGLLEDVRYLKTNENNGQFQSFFAENQLGMMGKPLVLNDLGISGNANFKDFSLTLSEKKINLEVAFLNQEKSSLKQILQIN